MKIQSVIEVKNGDTLGATREFLKRLLDEGVVDTMLVPLEVPSADQVSPILVKEAKQLDSANPLAPVMRVNAAAVLARVQREETSAKMGAVVRPCELRAVVELAKLGRIDLDHVALIAIDCMGTYEPEAYTQIALASADSPTDEVLRWTRQGPIAPYRLRNSCQMCEHFFAENADIAIGLIGMNVRERLAVELNAELAAKFTLAQADQESRERAIGRLASIRRHRYDEAVSRASALLSDLPSLIGLLAPCTACGECVDACPFCGTDAFVPKSSKEPHTDRLRDWPAGEGRMVRERAISPMSGIIEWGRRAASCVACGMCESACPRPVPLTAIQAVLGRKVREEFAYVPGRSIDEKLPWAVS